MGNFCLQRLIVQSTLCAKNILKKAIIQSSLYCEKFADISLTFKVNEPHSCFYCNLIILQFQQFFFLSFSEVSSTSWFNYPVDCINSEVPSTVWCSSVFDLFVGQLDSPHPLKCLICLILPPSLLSLPLPWLLPQPLAVQGSNDAAQTRTRYPGVH